MESLAVPLIAATVFTAGGYAITRIERHAEAVGDWLFTVMVMICLVGCAVLANQALERRRPVLQADGVMSQGRAAVPSGKAWARLDGP